MDLFSLDILLELIDQSKTRIKNELDMKTLDNDKLSVESDNLLQVLDYTPKTLYSEKELLESKPVIKLKSKSKPEQKPQKINKHLKLVSTPNIDMDSIAIKNNINDKRITTNFISKMEKEEKNENLDKKGKEEKKEENDDDEDDEEFERQLAQRQRQIEERERKKKKLNDEDLDFVRHHKTTKEFFNNEFKKEVENKDKDKKIENNILIKLKVYLFKSNNNIIIDISKKDTIKDIKIQIIKILQDKKHILKYTTYKAYNIIKENSINGKDSPLDDDIILYDLKPKFISFIENEDYNSTKENLSEKFLDEIKNTKIQEKKIDIKINYNINGSIKTKIINISQENNLKEILNIFFNENILEDKNFELYYFTDKKQIQDINNAINLDTLIKNLSSNELSLYAKNDINNNDDEMLFISDKENNIENKNENDEEQK
jgi:hypothetical protein